MTDSAATGLRDAAAALLAGGRGRPRGAALRGALADLYEFWLARAATAAGVGTGDRGVALVAVGGLGRGELVPCADLDLVLLHEGDRRIGRIAEALWYPLWDAGVGLDHAVRTPGEALLVAAGDARTAIGLLDVRHLAGDAELTARLAARAREHWRRTARRRLPALAAAARERWHRGGEVARSAAPDLKHGRGGLRDLVLLDALALAQLVDRPGEQVRAARGLLLDVRTELRRETRRDRDALGAAEAAAVAAELGFPDRFGLARELSGAGRAVAYALDVAFRAALPSTSTMDRTAPGGGRPERVPLAEGVVRHGAEVALARDAVPARDPALVLRVANAAARSGWPIAQGTLRVLAATAPEPRAPWPAGTRDALVLLLGAGEGLVDVVEALDQAGLWARLFPEWGAVRDLPPREPSHEWTVDRHLVRTCVAAAAQAGTVSRPDLLLLGALLHDIGKGRGTDHCELGAAIAAQVCDRLGLSEVDGARVVTIVRHHLLLPDTATRRDIAEPATVRHVVDALDGDPLVVELAHALAAADSLATGPGVWTEWKAALVDELTDRCRDVLRGRPPAAPEPVPPEHAALATEAVRSGRGQVRISAIGNVATVLLAVPAGAELLVPAAAVLALHSLDVHAASLRAHDGARVGLFTASPRFGTLPVPALLREQFVRAVAGDPSLGRRLAAKERDYGAGPGAVPAPRLLWFDDETVGVGTVVLELRAPDRIGLLHLVAGALRDCAAGVRWAKVVTLGGMAVGSFAVAPAAGRPDAAWRARVERVVLAATRAGVVRTRPRPG